MLIVERRMQAKEIESGDVLAQFEGEIAVALVRANEQQQSVSAVNSYDASRNAILFDRALIRQVTEDALIVTHGGAMIRSTMRCELSVVLISFGR